MNLIYDGKLLDFEHDKAELISLIDGSAFPTNLLPVTSAVYSDPYVLLVNKHGVNLYDEMLAENYCAINLTGKLFILNSVPYLFNGKFFELSYEVSKKSALAAKQIKHICVLPPLGEFISFDEQVFYISPNHEILIVQNVENTIVAENLNDAFASPDFLSVIYYQGMLFYVLEECITICFLNDLSLVDVPIQMRNPFIYGNKIRDEESCYAIQELLLKYVKPIATKTFEILTYPPKLPETAEYHSFRQEFALCNIEANNGLQIHPFPYSNVALLNRSQIATRPMPYGVESTNFFFDPPLTLKIDDELELSDFERIFTIKHEPAPRRNFCFVFFSPFDFFLFGGIGENEYVHNELYCGTVDFDAKTVVYRKIETENAPKLHSAVMVMNKDEIYLLWGTQGSRRSGTVYQLKRVGEKIRFKQVLEFDEPHPYNGVQAISIEECIVVIGPQIALYNTQTGCWSQAHTFPEALPYMNYLIAYEDDQLLCYSAEFKFNLSLIYNDLKGTFGEGRIEEAFEYLGDLVSNDYMGSREYCAENRVLVYKLLCTKCFVEDREVLEEIIDVSPGKLLVDFVGKCLEKMRIEVADVYNVGEESIVVKRSTDVVELTVWLCEI